MKHTMQRWLVGGLTSGTIMAASLLSGGFAADAAAPSPGESNVGQTSAATWPETNYVNDPSPVSASFVAPISAPFVAPVAPVVPTITATEDVFAVQGSTNTERLSDGPAPKG